MNLIMTQTELALGVGVLAADQWMEYHRPKRWHSADQSVYMQMCWPAKEQSNGVQRTKALPCKRVGMLKNKAMACSGPKRLWTKTLAWRGPKPWHAGDQSIGMPQTKVCQRLSILMKLRNIYVQYCWHSVAYTQKSGVKMAALRFSNHDSYKSLILLEKYFILLMCHLAIGLRCIKAKVNICSYVHIYDIVRWGEGKVTR